MPKFFVTVKTEIEFTVAEFDTQEEAQKKADSITYKEALFAILQGLTQQGNAQVMLIELDEQAGRVARETLVKLVE